jgi:hypothetical protein
MSSDNAAYIGTDDGVYYQSPSNTDWLPFYNDLPRVAVTDLILFPTDGYIYASTFGRGIWYSPLKEACSENLSLAGETGGRVFYQANNIATTQNVTGIDSTIVFYRGTNSVVMQPGFSVTAGNLMKAYIGDCDEHGIPDFRGQANQFKQIDSPGYLQESNQLRKNGAWLAYLEYTPQQKKENKINITAKESGDYIIRLSNAQGQPIKEFTVNFGEASTKEVQLKLPDMVQGMYYLELRKDKSLCHFLEWGQ